jgi:hypothetical protein
LMRLLTSVRLSRSSLRLGVGESIFTCQYMFAGFTWKSHFSKGAPAQRLPVCRFLLPQFALTLQLGELGLLCEDLIAPLLHGRLHGEVWMVFGRKGVSPSSFWSFLGPCCISCTRTRDVSLHLNQSKASTNEVMRVSRSQNRAKLPGTVTSAAFAGGSSRPKS